MSTTRKPNQAALGARRSPSARGSALGEVADILPTAKPERLNGRAASSLPVVSPKTVTQRVADRDGKAQSIYLRDLDIDRANDIEHAVRKAKRVGGRVGLSLIMRAGLRLLAEEFDKDPKHGVDLVAAVAESE